MRELVYRLGPRAARLARRLSGSYPDPEYQSPHHPAWSLMRAILEQWIGEARAPVVLVPLPLPQHLDEVASPRGYHARFAELARPAVAVHDPLPDLLHYPRAERRALRFPTDVHFTIAGHEALADSLEPVIRTRVEDYAAALAAR